MLCNLSTAVSTFSKVNSENIKFKVVHYKQGDVSLFGPKTERLRFEMSVK